MIDSARGIVQYSNWYADLWRMVYVEALHMSFPAWLSLDEPDRIKASARVADLAVVEAYERFKK